MDNEILFEDIKGDLCDFFGKIAKKDIKAIVEGEVYEAGLKCFTTDKIGDFEYVTNEKLIASVQDGEEDFEIIIETEEGSVIYSCDCESEGKCEHVVAVLLYAVENKHIGIANKYLQTLSQDELVSIILQQTSKQFLTSLK